MASEAVAADATVTKKSLLNRAALLSTARTTAEAVAEQVRKAKAKFDTDNAALLNQHRAAKEQLEALTIALRDEALDFADAQERAGEAIDLPLGLKVVNETRVVLDEQGALAWAIEHQLYDMVALDVMVATAIGAAYPGASSWYSVAAERAVRIPSDLKKALLAEAWGGKPEEQDTAGPEGA